VALDFPNTPVDGQVYDNFIYDASKGTWKSLSSGASPSLLVSPTITNAVITATATTPSTVPITVNGAASQSANLQEWKNSAGIVLADVDSVGNLQAPKLGLGGAVPPTSPSSTHLQVNGRAKILSNGAESAGIWLTGSNNVDTAFIGQLSPTTTDPVGIYHNGAWRFTVDSLGRVNTPSQPTFFAWQPESGTFMSSGGVIVFGSTQINIGSGYNTSNGRFTAPVAGVYQFNAQMLLRTNTAPGEATFFRNGANVISRNLSYSLPIGANAHDPMHFMIYINLAAGDFIDVRTSIPGSGADWYFGGGLSWFCGRLVG
jgi:hypothetical protein